MVATSPTLIFEPEINKKENSTTHSWDLFSYLFSTILQFIFSKFCLFVFFLAWSKVGELSNQSAAPSIDSLECSSKKLNKKQINKIWRIGENKFLCFHCWTYLVNFFWCNNWRSIIKVERLMCVKKIRWKVGLLFWANFIGLNKRVGWKIC